MAMKMMKMIKAVSISTVFLVLTGCQGYRYGLIEDRNRYLLTGEFYNHNPFITIKAIVPNSFLVDKSPSGTTGKEGIKSTGYRGERIVGGTIEDRGSEVEIRLTVRAGDEKQDREAYENGKYTIHSRRQVEDIHSYVATDSKLRELKP